MARLFVVVVPSSINVDANLEESQITHEAVLDTAQKTPTHDVDVATRILLAMPLRWTNVSL